MSTDPGEGTTARTARTEEDGRMTGFGLDPSEAALTTCDAVGYRAIRTRRVAKETARDGEL